MKRSVLNAFTAAIDEIVARGKLKDEEGNLYYPVMEEPVVMAFFGAPEALSEVILQRPIMLINLIMTNKALKKFWEQTPDVWLILIDNFILQETNQRFQETYPFFAIANRRARAVLDLLPSIQPYIRANYRDGDFMYKSSYLDSPFNKPGNLLGHDYTVEEEVRYQLVYYDSVTKSFIEMLQLLTYLQLDHGQLERLFILDPPKKLALYLSIEYHPRDLTCLEDCFLIDSAWIRKGSIAYNLQSMLDSVNQVMAGSSFYLVSDVNYNGEVTITMSSGLIVRTFGTYPRSIRDMFVRVKALAHSLRETLEDHFRGKLVILQEPPVYLELNKAIATPYRAMMYDNEQGVYNTQEKQRTLLLALLRNAANRTYDAGDLITKYGHGVPLACSMCANETFMADSLLKRAFCTERCRSLFLK